VLFLDDDVVVHRGCLQAHIHAHARDGAIGVVAGRVCQQGENAWAPIEVPAEVDPQSGVTRGNFDLAVPGDALYATGCNMSLKRAVFFRAGMFDPRFRGSGLFEEVDMCYRVRRAGYRIRFCPEAALTHTPHARGGGRTGPPLVRLYDRLHNHCVFYFRHIRRLPSPAFVKEVRNLAEYISRKPDTGHSAARLCRCALEVVTGYIHAHIPWWFPRP
jgi:GT2 family glycosyltransferase